MSRLKQVRLGITCIKEGFLFFKHRPSTIWLAIAPALIGTTFSAALIALLIHFHSNFYSWLTDTFISHMLANLPIGNGITKHILYSSSKAIEVLLYLVSIALSILIPLLAGFLVYMIIAAPFNDAISKKVENNFCSQLSYNSASFFNELFKTVKVELQKLLLLAVPILSLSLNLLPVIGNLSWATFTIMFGMWELGLSYTDYPMSRRSLSLKQRLKFGCQHKWALIGFGCVFTIPFFGIIFSAPLAAGGTILYLKLTGDVKRPTL